MKPRWAHTTKSGRACVGSNGVAVNVDGGAPMLLDGNITLCARSDLDSSRFFNGAVTTSVLTADPAAFARQSPHYQRCKRLIASRRACCCRVQHCLISLRRCDNVRELHISLRGGSAGRLASLSVFDAALGPDGVQQLFQQGIAGVTGVGAVGMLLMLRHCCREVRTARYHRWRVPCLQHHNVSCCLRAANEAALGTLAGVPICAVTAQLGAL